jgi:hypothetical protein
MTSILSSISSGLDIQAMRQQFQQQAFNRLSGGGSTVNLKQWEQALQNLPGAVNAGSTAASSAGVTGTGTASAIDAAFKSIDANGDGQLSATEFGAAMDKMLDRARHRPKHGTGDSALDAQLLGQQQPSGGVQAPDFLRRMLLGYSANA